MLSDRGTVTADRTDAGETLRYLQFTAYCLKHAILEIQAAFKVDAALCTAYSRYLRPLDSLGGIPDDLRVPIRALFLDLGTTLGFDSASGARIVGPAPQLNDADAIVARLEVIASAVAKMMAGADRHRDPPGLHG